MWLLIVLGTACALIVAAIAVKSARLSATPPASLCRGCGYDLRGLSSGTCPECGWNDGSWAVRQDQVRRGLSRIDTTLVLVVIPLLAALVVGMMLLYSPGGR
ncbi:MAG: hypothetical protein KF787_07600 [Phycisphaeraceae bacterium]|nr:hypothetical protein [Phycisphaerae bacterium]MBX3392496.1 hypothetical protein [Phycisphaeraceae bacterium]